MKSAKIFVFFILLPIATVEMQFIDFINAFFENDGLRPFDAKEFKEDLRKSLYGQHIALETICRSVSWFMKDPNPPKPLVLSIHGPTGVGKTYVTKIIARNIYEMGEKSKHFHKFKASYHFPNKQHTEMYETQLKQWIHGSVSSFPHSMFIFDEMEKMDSHLIGTIKPFLDYMSDVDGVSFQNAIFIFLSNAGQDVINNITLDLMREGKAREEIQMYSKEMETKMYQYIFDNKDTGFRHSCLIGEHLVDHFIPFLPLELRHVRQCVLAEMANLNIPIAQYPDLADTVVRQMPFFPPEEKIFSVKGCKIIWVGIKLWLDDANKDLNSGTENGDLMLKGSLFHNVGPATSKVGFFTKFIKTRSLDSDF